MKFCYCYFDPHWAAAMLDLLGLREFKDKRPVLVASIFMRWTSIPGRSPLFDLLILFMYFLQDTAINQFLLTFKKKYLLINSTFSSFPLLSLQHVLKPLCQSSQSVLLLNCPLQFLNPIFWNCKTDHYNKTSDTDDHFLSDCSILFWLCIVNSFFCIHM